MQTYLEVHQTRDREPTVYEDLLGDALERAYGQGIHDLDGIVALLNRDCVPTPGGVPWTDDLLKSELARLGA